MAAAVGEVSLMIPLKAGLIAWSVAGPVLAGGMVYLTMLGREAIVTRGAILATRNDEISKCNARQREMAATIDTQVTVAVEAAIAAANAEKPTPEAQAEINALCKRSASCRDRGEMP